MKDLKITHKTKVVLLFEVGGNRIPVEETIEWYLEQLGERFGNDRIMGDWYYFRKYDKLWEVKTTIYAIVSWLSYIFEYDDLFYMIRNNTIYIDKLKVEEKVR